MFNYLLEILNYVDGTQLATITRLSMLNNPATFGIHMCDETWNIPAEKHDFGIIINT